MPRIARLVVPGLPHHVTQRGVRSISIFHDEEDRRAYLETLAETADKHGLTFWGWCLMTNHIHLVAVPREEESLAKGIGEAHWRYTRHVNFREGTRGRLFQGRFESYPVDRDRFLVAVLRYVELNPVKAGLVTNAEDWPWSSAAFNVGEREKDALVTRRVAEEFASPWRTVLRDGEEEAERKRIALHLGTGRPYGSDEWIDGLERQTGRTLRPGKRGWPKGRPRKKVGA